MQTSAKLPIVERSDLFDELDGMLRHAASERSMLGLIAVELSQIDEINNEFGYAVGDALLRLLTAQIFQYKRGNDLVVRISTNQVLIILPGLKSNGVPLLAAQRLHAHCAQRVQVEGRWLRPVLRMGLSLFPHDGTSSRDLLRGADSALLQARRLNQDIVTFSETCIGPRMAMLETQHDLANAITSGELFCHFQPKIALADDRFVSTESLIRWRSNTGAMIPPNRFIPVAEENGMIVPLTFSSLNESLRECAEMQSHLPGLSVAVNLSALVLTEPNLEDIVSEALNTWGIAPELLVLEVTESAVMKDVDENLRTLADFRDRGIGISIDDFGTGFSSLSYLRKLPATELKIDRSFISNLLADDNSLQLVRAIIDIARGFNLKTVAEGIEDAATLARLRELGCDHAQGFYIARPMPPDELLSWFAQAPWSAPDARRRESVA
jgi:diguanylate cyclase (GGDEF)-like protein